jgi:hypothetical protein
MSLSQKVRLTQAFQQGRRVVVRIPYQARPGERRLKVVVDPDNRVPEPNENNNTQERTVTVPVPDVAISAELLPNNPGTGSPFYVRGVVRNDGATTIVPFRVVAEVLDESDKVIAYQLPSVFGGHGRKRIGKPQHCFHALL